MTWPWQRKRFQRAKIYPITMNDEDGLKMSAAKLAYATQGDEGVPPDIEEYLREHGQWPDDAPPNPQTRKPTR